MPRNDEFGAAMRELRESRIAALAASAANQVTIAANHSRIVMRADSVVRGFRALPAVARLRLVALAIAVAAATYVALEMLVPPHFAPMAPLWLSVAAAILSAAVAVAARSE